MLSSLGVARVLIYLDSPVSNSGRLKGMLLEAAAEQGWPWAVELVPSPDAVLARAEEGLVATADSGILDRCGPWLSLNRLLVSTRVPDAYLVDLS